MPKVPVQRWWFVMALIGLVLIIGVGGPPPTTAQDDPASNPYFDDVPTYFCDVNLECPEILIEGDPIATLGDEPAFFRGYGDPMLQYDPETAVLWLGYSWLDVVISDYTVPIWNFGVRTHLARSQDNGQTFQFVSVLNAVEPYNHPVTEQETVTTHEIVSFARLEGQPWQVMWFDYFSPLGSIGNENGIEFHIVRATGPTLDKLNDDATPWISGWAVYPHLDIKHQLNRDPALADCAVFTEHTLFAYEGTMYLAAHCLVVENNAPIPNKGRLVLFRETTDGYARVGDLLQATDAAPMGYRDFTQADLSLTRDGRVILSVVPEQSSVYPRFNGCLVFEVTDITAAEVKREADGTLVKPLLAIFAPDPAIELGMCTYDAASETGILTVISIVELSPNDIDVSFSLRATGIHP